MSMSRPARATKTRPPLRVEQLEDRLTPAFTAFPTDAPLPYSSAITSQYRDTSGYTIPTAADNPAGVYYVSPTGSAANSGLDPALPTTVAKAFQTINGKPSGQNAAVVFRGGTYRDVAINPANHALTLQAYPGEKPVINGTKVITAWTFDAAKNLWYMNAADPDGTGPINYLSKGTDGESVDVNDNPFYNDLEQVFLDGKPLWQVGSAAEVTDDTFWTDTANSRIYIKSNPAGKTVEVTAYRIGFDLFNMNDPDPSTVRGLNFTGYATAGIFWGTYQGGDSFLGSIEDNTFSWNGQYGVSVQDTGTTTAGLQITNNAFIANGEMGLISVRNNNLSFTNNVAQYNNVQRAATYWSAAGVKSVRSTGQVYQNNNISNNYSTGLWIDVYQQKTWVLQNEIANNSGGPAVFVELSNDNVVAFNLIHDNNTSGVGQAGVQIVDSSATRVFNNTLVGNYTGVSVYETSRGLGGAATAGGENDSTAYANGVTRDAFGNVVKNNLIINANRYGNYLAAGGTKPVSNGIGVAYGGTVTNPLTLPRISPSMFAPGGLDFNNYFSTSTATTPITAVTWDWTESAGPTNYSTLAAFKASLAGKTAAQVSAFNGAVTTGSLTGIEANSKAINPLFTGTGGAWTFYRPTASGLNVGADIPTDILSRVGLAAGTKFLGAIEPLAAPPNQAPTDIKLNGGYTGSVPENVTGAVVGTLVGTDPNAGDALTFSLSTSKSQSGRFSIVNGNQLVTNYGQNFEAAPNPLTVYVVVTDSGNLTYERSFQITITDVNETPTDIALSGASVAENQPSGTFVGTLSATDPDASQTFTYALVAGTGSTDNASFTVSGNQLKTAAGFDFETKNSFSVRVRVTDQGGLTFEEVFTIGVTNVNEAPTDLKLSGGYTGSVPENAAGALVGTLQGFDPDAGTVFTYQVYAPPFYPTTKGQSGRFQIVNGNELRTLYGQDYEALPNPLTVFVVATDAGGLTYERSFQITITNVAEAASTTIGDGTQQRSAVKSVTLAFDAPVVIDANAFTLTRTGGGTAITVPVAVATQLVDGRTIATLTFSGAGTEFGSLADGVWTLTAAAGSICDAGTNATVFAGGYSNSFHRLFGDADGDRDVDAADNAAFQAAYGSATGGAKYKVFFDFNGDGVINGTDMTALRSRYGKTI
jgi:hypothetical protein